jgi:hypothetical protein
LYSQDGEWDEYDECDEFKIKDLQTIKGVIRYKRKNRRSLHYAPPDSY